MNDWIRGPGPHLLTPGPVLSHMVAQGGKDMGSRRPSVTCLLYQGTTGSPKGATLSHYNIVNNSNMIGDRLRLHLKVRGLAQALQGGGRVGGGLLGSPCWLGEERGFWLQGRTSLLPPAPDGRELADHPAQPPVPLPGLCGWHNGEHNARCHPHPTLSGL